MDGNELIGTRQPAPRQAEMALMSWQSRDYWNGIPYPRHAFGPQQWPAEKGPFPTPLPYVETLIREGAEFIFRNGAPAFSIPDDPDADKWLQEIIEANSLDAQWESLAEDAAHQGAIAAKWSFDADDEDCPVRISFLHVPQECRVWVDPHNRNRLLLARIQYPFRDLATGEWMYYREEWTDDRYVVYVPRKAGASSVSSPQGLPGYDQHLGDGGESDLWEVQSDEPNDFGVIPVMPIRNRAVQGNPLGEGDCWRIFRLIDRIALTLHGEDRSNQFHSEPIPVVKNAHLKNSGPLMPGEPIEVVNDNPEGPAADMELLEPTGAAREFSHRSMDKWEDLLYKAVGLSRVNPAEVTNKGNMTSLAFAMTYGRTIATSDRKRKAWGDDGMCRFFRNLLRGMQAVGGIEALGKVKRTSKVAVTWPAYFQATDADLSEVTDRTKTQVDAGFISPEKGAERVLTAEKLPKGEIAEELDKLKGRHAATLTASTQPAPAGEQDPVTLGSEAAGAVGANNFTA